jgi:branched-chain amino acid transport system ATP-binding protein
VADLPTSGAADAGLTVRGLSVRYDHVTAVDDVDLHVAPGEAVALLGANGAGKTSTLHAISRLVPSTGALSFGGVDLTRRSAEGVARTGIAHAPEGRRLFPGLTVHDNLRLGRTARNGRPERFSVDDVYDLFPALVPLRRRSAWALSGGEQQMVAIGRALLSSPRLLLLDEPSLGLAPVVVRAVFDVLGDIVQHVPVLLVEQNTTLALELCQRAYVMAEGRIVLDGTADELSDRDAVLRSFLGTTRS